MFAHHFVRVAQLIHGVRTLRVGFSEELLDERGHLDQDVILLQKPFSARDLLLTVRSVLDAA
jgi:hypothetical protein